MEGEHVVPLMQLGLELRRALNHRFIVTENVRLLADWNTQILFFSSLAVGTNDSLKYDK